MRVDGLKVGCTKLDVSVVCVYVCVYVRACAHACVRMCVCVRVYACACVRRGVDL